MAEECTGWPAPSNWAILDTDETSAQQWESDPETGTRSHPLLIREPRFESHLYSSCRFLLMNTLGSSRRWLRNPFPTTAANISIKLGECTPLKGRLGKSWRNAKRQQKWSPKTKRYSQQLWNKVFKHVDKNTVEVNNLQASRRHPCNVKKRDARHVTIELDSKKNRTS